MTRRLGFYISLTMNGFLVTPTALSRGKAMFAELDAPLRLRLTGTRTFSSGSVLLEYEPST
jgi:hypothetical protein